MPSSQSPHSVVTSAGAAPLLQRVSWMAAPVGFVAYESALHHAAHTPGAEVSALWLGLAPFLLIALVAAWRSAPRLPWLLLLAACGLALWVGRMPLAAHFGWTYFLQHFGANAALAAMFGRTLRPGGMPLCTEFAAAVHGPLTPDMRRYTRRVTQAWTLFFALTAAASLVLFALAPMPAWSTFANLGTPALVALMFVAEAACRRVVLPAAQHTGVLDAVRGYRAVMTERASRAGTR
ncbi:acyl carrier protein [Cupriavidus sp. WKF15]|uniref:COG4648 family protein n=1 Tax=Cupriavidus sp. WKF15 TaxID=3032282 RepID=UPI0023E0CB6E|nr:acyl carrier protein [Cupriavidus sp. WKF15]WER48173.1 acyl carrier protein [Cupriavidus sp. WKF15]